MRSVLCVLTKVVLFLPVLSEGRANVQRTMWQERIRPTIACPSSSPAATGQPRRVGSVGALFFNGGRPCASRDLVSGNGILTRGKIAFAASLRTCLVQWTLTTTRRNASTKNTTSLMIRGKRKSCTTKIGNMPKNVRRGSVTRRAPMCRGRRDWLSGLFIPGGKS